MANFDDLKQKAKDAMGTIADVSVEVYKIAEEKAKVLAKTAKLNAEITREKSLVKKNYYDIGAKYYEMYKATPGEAFEQSCNEITDALDRIESKRRELEDLKNSADLSDDEILDAETEIVDDEPDIEVEITIEQPDDASPDGE